MSTTFPEAEIAEVRRILGKISSTDASVREERDVHEHRMIVEPRHPDLCQFSVSFGTYGSYTLCFGHGLAFEEIEISEFSPVEVVTAIMAGNAREATWELGRRVTRSRGRLVLADGRTLGDLAILSVLGLLKIGRRRERHYRAYPRDAGAAEGAGEHTTGP